MLSFHRGMDPNSLDVKQNGEHIGFLQWHTGTYTLQVWPNERTRHVDLTLSELEQVVQKAKDLRK